MSLVDLEIHKKVNLGSRWKESRTLLDSLHHCCLGTVLFWEMSSIIKSCKPISQKQIKEWNTSPVPVWACRRLVSFPTQSKTCPTTILPFVFTGDVPGGCQSPGLSTDVLSPSSPGSPWSLSSSLQSLPSSTAYTPQLAVGLSQWEMIFLPIAMKLHPSSRSAEFNKESQPKFSKSHKCRFNSTSRSYLQEIN